jgi:hypothetical protein
MAGPGLVGCAQEDRCVEKLELVPLCSAVIRVGEVVTLEGTPSGTLMIGELASSRWEGERLRARQRGRAAADWLLLSPDGTGRVDVRMTLETDDGALLFVEYTGRFDPGTGRAWSTPTFRTGDPRYAWLNRVQAVAKGFFDAQAMTLTYPVVYELR